MYCVCICPHSVLCIVYVSQNKQRLLPYTALNGLYKRDGECLLRGANCVFKFGSLRFDTKGLNDGSRAAAKTESVP